MATTYRSSRWNVRYVRFNGGYVTVTDAAILRAVQKKFGHTIWLTQGGLSTSVAASSYTHAGLGAFDISTRGLTRAQVWKLCALLISCGIPAFARGYVYDSFQGRTVANTHDGNEHVHCASNESFKSLHPQAQAQVRAFKRGRDGLMGNRAFTGPSTKLGKWSKSPLNPKNDKAAKAAAKAKAAAAKRVDPKDVTAIAKTSYWVTADKLLGLDVTRKTKYVRAKGYRIDAVKLVKRFGRTNAVTAAGTYYALSYLTKTSPKPPVKKPVAKPAVVVKPAVAKPVLAASVTRDWPALARKHEGVCGFLYLDSLGLVTCGIGQLVDSVAATQKLPWYVKATNERATPQQVAAEWTKVKSKQADKHRGGKYFVKYQTLYLSNATIDQLLLTTTAAFVRTFVGYWPKFSTWEPSAQLAVVDLMFQNGPHFTQVKKDGQFVWVDTRAAFAAQDWKKAAKAVPGAADSGRRKTRVALFEAAAKAKSAKTAVKIATVVVTAAAAGVAAPAVVKPPVTPPVAVVTPKATPKPTATPTPTPKPAATPTKVSTVTIREGGYTVVCTAPCSVTVDIDDDADGE